ncbi:MAG TPA: dTDP-4-dehydrorhamnose reductase [Methylomirabilota bacterium]|nr:dTDP-4-dehydrorhamnose reductase [Methylomirabilota bacterium]
MKILVTGAAGLVGRHLARTLSLHHEVAALGHGDLDITNRQALDRCVAAVRPALIFNCAVLQVDESERDLAKARAVNAEGPGYLAEAASRHGAEIVHFSTQYVFDGEPLGRAPYTIIDAPSPVNVYGKTKLIGEAAVREACAQSYIVRTSWVYGSGKNSFLCAAPGDLKAKKKIRAIDDIWSSTTYVEDLIERVMLIQRTGFYATYHIVNAGVCTYYEFALEAGRLLGLGRRELDALIEVAHERDMKRIARRPRYTPLRCLLSEELGFPPMRDWREALAEYARQ